MSNPMKVDYSASDFLGGTILLDAWEELAFRRICDLVYATHDKLPDDSKMGQLTKTGRRWAKIRLRLVELEKIEIVDGRISQPRCRKELTAAHERIAAASKGGKASAKKRKSDIKPQISASTTRADVEDVGGDKCPQNDTIPVSEISGKPLENNITDSTVVGLGVGTQDPTQEATTHQPPTIEERTPPIPDGIGPPMEPPPIPANLVRKPKNGTAKRGARLAPDWQPTAEHSALGDELGITGERFRAETEKFRDYWAAESGQRASKLDWNAAFRVWLRKAAEYAGGGANGTGQSHTAGNRQSTASVAVAYAQLQDRTAGGGE